MVGKKSLLGLVVISMLSPPVTVYSAPGDDPVPAANTSTSIPTAAPIASTAASPAPEVAMSAIDALVNEAKTLYGKSDFAQAESKLREAMAIDANNSQANYWLGQIFLKKGDTEQGIEYVKRSVDLMSDNSRLWQALGQVYESVDDNEKAEQAYNKAIELAPRNLDVQLDLGRLMVKTGRSDEAIDQYSQLINSNRNTRQAATAISFRQTLLAQWAEQMAVTLESGKAISDQAYDLALERTKLLILSSQPALALPVLNGLVKIRPNDPQVYFWFGRAYFLVGDATEGLRLIRKSVELASDNQRLQSTLGAALEDAGKDDEAAEIYERILASVEEDLLRLDVQRRLGLLNARRFEADGQYDQAADEYLALIDSFPNDVGLLLKLINVNQKMGRPEAVDEYFDKALALRPNDPELYLSLSIAQRQRGNITRADDYLVKALELDTRGVIKERARQSLGFPAALDALQRKDHTTALDILNKILVVMPNDALVYANLAETYASMEDYEKAVDAYTQSLKIAPANMEVRLRLARTYAQLDREDDVLDMLESIAQDGRGTKQGQEADQILLSMEKNIIKRGKRLLEKGDLAGAEKIFRRLLLRSPDSAQGHYWLGQVNLRREKFDEGLSDIKKSSDLTPKNAGIKQALAMAYVEAGMLQDAERAFLEAIAMAPKNLGVRARLVNLYQRQGQDEKAQEQLEFIVKNAQEAGVEQRDILMQLGLAEGIALLDKKQPEAALEIFNRVLALIPDALVYTHIGMAQEQLGDKAAAKTAYKKAMEMAPADAEPRLKLGMLESAEGNIDEALNLLEPIAVRKEETLAASADAEVQRLYNIWAAGLIERFTVEPTKITDTEVKQAVDRSKSLVFANRLDAAEPLLDILYLRRPKNAEVNFWLGKIAMKRQRYDEGLAYITRSTALLPGNLRLRLQLGDAIVEAGKTDLLVKHWLKTITDFPGRADLYLKLATAYELVGDDEKAREGIVDSLEYAKDAQRKEAIGRLGFTKGSTLLSEKKWDAALDSFNDVLDVVPDDAATHALVGDAYIGKGDKDKAIDAYKLALQQDENNISVLVKLAGTYRDDGRDEEAISTYEKLSTLPLKTRDRRKVDSALDELYGEWSTATVAMIKGESAEEPLDTEAVIARSRQLSLKHKYHLARPVLEAYISFFPEDSQANYWLGQALIKDKETGAGLSYIKKSTELAPENVRLLAFYAEALKEAGKDQEAIAVYDSVINRTKNKGLINSATKSRGLLLARNYKRDGDFEAANSELAKLARVLPNDPAIWLLRADYYRDEKRYSEAEHMYKQALTLDKRHAEAYMHLAEVYLAVKNKDAARAVLINAAHYARPDQQDIKVRALALLGMRQVNQLLRAKKFNDALGVLKVLNKKLPNESLVLKRIADVFYLQRDIASAEKMYQLAIKADRRNLEARHALAKLYLATKQSGKAIETLEFAVDYSAPYQDLTEIEELLTSLYASRAEKLRKEGKAQEALAFYKKQVESDPTDARAYYNLGVMYKSMRDADGAIAAFEKVVEYRPDNYAAYASLALLYPTKGKIDKAIDALANAIAVTTDVKKGVDRSSDLTLLLVQKLAGEKKTGHALRELFALRDRDPAKVQSHYYLGVLFSQQGSIEQAINSYLEVVRLSPENTQVRFNLGVLYERTSDYDLALDQYNAIVSSGATGLLVERARLRMESVLSQLSPFDAKLSYTATQGTTEIETAASDTFNSTLSIDMKLNVRPHKNLLVSAGESVSYAANHTTQTDSLASTFNLDADLNFENIFFGVGGSYREDHGLLVEELRGNNISLYSSGTLRYKRLFGFLDAFKREESLLPERGFADIERVNLFDEKAPVAKDDLGDENFTDKNSALQNALESFKDSSYEEIKSHVVKEGDSLWGIANVLLEDPYLWPELWYVNPNITNPHLIYPNDKVSLVYVNGKPMLILQREGQEASPEVLGVDEGLTLFKQGVSFLVAEKYEQSIAAFKEILQFVPDDILTNIYIGIAYMGLGEYELAEDSLKTAISLDNQNVMALFKLAAVYQEMSRLSDAIYYYEQVLELDPEGFYAQRAKLILADLYRDRALIAAAALSPSSAPEELNTVIAYVKALLESGDDLGAELVLRELLGWVPENIEANAMLGSVYVEQKSYVEALPYLENCHAVAPDHFRCSYLLAKVYEQTGKLDDAEALYFDLLGSADIEETVMWDVQYHLGVVRGRQFIGDGQYDAALQEFVSLTALFTDDTALRLLIGETYIQLGRVDDAIAIYEAVTNESSENIPAMLVLADLYLHNDMQEQAMMLLKKVVALKPDADVMKKLLMLLGFQDGLDLIESGDYDEALIIFEAMREVAPDEPLVLLNIGLIYQAQGRPEASEAIIKQVSDADPANMTARMMLGFLYADTERLAEAIFELEKVLSVSRGSLIEQRTETLLDKLRLKELEQQKALEAGEPVPKTLSGRLNYSEFVSAGVSFFETFTYGGSLSFTYPGGTWGNWSFTYGYNDVSNKHEFGRDYAYISSSYSVRFSRPIWSSKIRGLSGGLSFSRTIKNYKNIDTHALFGLGLSLHRYAVQDAYGMNLYYRLHDRLSFSLSQSVSKHDANLPIGFVYNIAGIPVSRQGATLGDYTSTSTSLNLRFTF